MSALTDRPNPRHEIETWLINTRANINSMRRVPMRRRTVGLNTPGMILDRMSVLAIKVRVLDPPNAMVAEKGSHHEMVLNQFVEMIHALNHASPGLSSANTKLYKLRNGEIILYDFGERDFSDALSELVYINTKMWNLHEPYYLQGVDTTSEISIEKAAETFLDVIHLNLQRSACMKRVDHLFWRC